MWRLLRRIGQETTEKKKRKSLFKKERVTVTTSHSVTPAPTDPVQHPHSHTQIGTIRTEEYKRDLAEFQARRSSGVGELPDTSLKKKCGRHSLPVSCTDCAVLATDHDSTFTYEKKSAMKYKKKPKRTRSATPEMHQEGLPNIQFLFQNQVFMPGNPFPVTSFSEPQRSRRQSRQRVLRSPDMDLLVQKHIEFKEEDQTDSPPMFFKNNSLPFDVKTFVDGAKSDEEDGFKAAGDVKTTSHGENKDDSGDLKLWEVMSELKHFDQWADEQLHTTDTSRSEDSRSETSAYGLPVASACNLNVTIDRDTMWNKGKWGVVPVQIKKLPGITVDHVRKKRNTEINILRKCRHPNIILLMGLYPDVQNNVHIICERCVDSLYGILHEQGRILSAQTSVQYALDIANALVFLRMQGYIHSGLTSMSVMVTGHDAAKLADLGPCVQLHKVHHKKKRCYNIYTPEPQYVNIDGTVQSNTIESEPLISEHPSEVYMSEQAVGKNYKIYKECDFYQWQAPELFTPDDEGFVYTCSRSDVYSLCLILKESCNAELPWKNLSYGMLKEQYTLWKTGVPLPQDGTYPGCLLALLQSGLKIQRNERMDLETLQTTLQSVKSSMDEFGYIIIPARLPAKKSDFSSTAWDTTSPTDSDCLSPQNFEHKAVVHGTKDSCTESEKECSTTDNSPLYETIRKTHSKIVCSIPEQCYISDDDNEELKPVLQYELMPEKEYSSACSTPIAKIRARIKDIATPGVLHKSDSTEYCSILSPNRTNNFTLNGNNSKEYNAADRSTAKLSKSFTPKSYKPLHIKVPEYNLDSIKPLLKDQNSMERSSYNFDIKNYSLPTTPIARSNKLRKNAWLSGDLNVVERCAAKLRDNVLKLHSKKDSHNVSSVPEAPVNSPSYANTSKSLSSSHDIVDDRSLRSLDTLRDSFTGLRRTDPPLDFLSPETDENNEKRTNSWSPKSSHDTATSKYKVDDEILAKLNVKPLVAIHERWIYEANRKTGRSMSLPDDNRSQMPAVKPASHCVDTLQNSLPQFNMKRTSGKCFRARPPSPNTSKNGSQWEHFCQARETIAKAVNFHARDSDRQYTWRKDIEKGISTENRMKTESMVDQSTDTRSIEEFIRDLIRKEFQHYLHEIADDASTTSKNEDILTKGVANIVDGLKQDTEKKKDFKSFSRVKINGNNKPLVQITFSRSGENSLQVLDNCVNVTICDSTGKLCTTPEESPDDGHVHALKRCQAFNAIQEARSTEDLYIDDELSSHIQENFGGRGPLLGLHDGALHEALCEQPDCCLRRLREPLFLPDTSDTVDGDTLVFKRSISIEERIHRIHPTPRKTKSKDAPKIRPKSEVFPPNITEESRIMSVSSPSLVMKDESEVEVNIENVLSYQDSSSEECLKCQDDDFELLERKIEEDLANGNHSSMTCGCLEKISEENLSTLNEDTDRD